MIIQGLKSLLGGLDERQVKILTAGSLLFFCLLSGGTLYLATRRVDASERRIRKVNQLREQAKTILSRHAVVKRQQAEVDTILEQDRAFKIKEFFTTVVAELGLTSNLSKQAEVTDPQDLGNGYSEIKLDASFSGLSTRQFVDLLYRIEQSERIYTKEVVLVKAPKSSSLDLTIVIATLQSKIAAGT